MRARWKQENGAVATLEAAFIYPIVIFIIAALVYLALYILQGAFLFMRGQQLANIAARCASTPGYENLGVSLQGGDFASLPSSSQVQGAVNDYQLLWDAYRYWNFGSGTIGQDTRAELEQEFYQLARTGSFLESDVRCELRVTNHLFTQYITVNIDAKPGYPRFLDYFGVGDALDYHFSVRSVVPDNSEFVRNADLVIDFTDFLLAKLHLKDNFGAYFSKIKTFVSDLGG